MILCAAIKLVNAHNESTLNAIPSSVVNLYSSTAVELYASPQDRRQNPAPDYVVSEMTHKFCPSVVPPHHLKLKKGFLVLIILSVLHPALMNGELFLLKTHTQRVVQVAALDNNENETVIYALHCIKFQFSYHAVKVTRMQILFRLPFAVTVQRRQVKTLKKLLVDRCSIFSPWTTVRGSPSSEKMY